MPLAIEAIVYLNNFEIADHCRIKIKWDRKDEPDYEPQRIYIRKMPKDLDESEIYYLLEDYGNITDIHIYTNAYGISKGRGYVDFESEDEADYALQLITNAFGSNRFYRFEKYLTEEERYMKEISAKYETRLMSDESEEESDEVSDTNEGNQNDLLSFLSMANLAQLLSEVGLIHANDHEEVKPTKSWGIDEYEEEYQAELEYKENKTSKEPECTICCERDVQRVMYPCGHRVCKPCGETLKRSQTKCPYCRKAIIDIIDFY